jgi:hypothetical protein
MTNKSSTLASEIQRTDRKHTLQRIVAQSQVCDPLDPGTFFANRVDKFGPIFFYVRNVFNIWTAAKNAVRAWWQYDGRDLREHMTFESIFDAQRQSRKRMTDAKSVQVGQHLKGVDKCWENRRDLVASQRDCHGTGE